MENYEIIKNIDLFSTRLIELKNASDLDGLVKKIEENEQVFYLLKFKKNCMYHSMK